MMMRALNLYILVYRQFSQHFFGEFEQKRTKIEEKKELKVSMETNPFVCICLGSLAHCRFYTT